MLGMKLIVEQIVTGRFAPLRKTWEACGEPRLSVIGSYRMGFIIWPRENCSHLVVFIDYALPLRGIAHVLALLFARAYAAWCTRRMVTDAIAAMARVRVLIRADRA